MTRINVGINPEELDNDHLLAEHREIKRVPNTIKSGKAIIKNIPEQFTLNTGHVKFFYNKLLFLKNRYIAIYEECIKRDFNVTNYIDAWNDIDESLMNDYLPTQRDRNILIERLISKRESYIKLKNIL